MSFPDDAGGTFEGRHGCPSELVVDRFAVGELSDRSAGELRAHLDTCEVCRRRVEQRRSGAVSVPELKRPSMLASIATRVASTESAPEPVPEPAGFLRRNAWLLLVPVFAALGAFAVWFLRR